MTRREFSFQLSLLVAGFLGRIKPIVASDAAGTKTQSGRFLFTRIDYSKNHPSVLPYGLKPNLSNGKGPITRLVEVDVSENSAPSIRDAVIQPMIDPHSVLFHPSQGTYICIPRISTSASVVDVRQMKETLRFESSPNFYFYGHGAVQPKSGLVFLSQTDARGRGTISIREPEKLKEIKTIPSFGHAPHDMQFIGEDLLVVANNGWDEKTPSAIHPSSLCLLDVSLNKPKLLRELLISRPGITVQHFSVSRVSKDDVEYFLGLDAPWTERIPEKGTALVASSRNLESVSYFSTSKPVSYFHGNILSIAGSASGQAVCTTTPQSAFGIWDVEHRKLQTIVDEIEHPMGVQLLSASNDKTRFLASTANSGLFIIDIKKTNSGSLDIRTSRLAISKEKTANIMGHGTLLGPSA